MNNEEEGQGEGYVGAVSWVESATDEGLILEIKLATQKQQEVN